MENNTYLNKITVEQSLKIAEMPNYEKKKTEPLQIVNKLIVVRAVIRMCCVFRAWIRLCLDTFTHSSFHSQMNVMKWHHIRSMKIA